MDFAALQVYLLKPVGSTYLQRQHSSNTGPGFA
jgi:hypothetical protein